MSIYKSWNTEMYCRNEMLISPQHTPKYTMVPSEDKRQYDE